MAIGESGNRQVLALRYSFLFLANGGLEMESEKRARNEWSQFFFPLKKCEFKNRSDMAVEQIRVRQKKKNK